MPPSRFLINPQKLNPYVYCINNPVLFIDPLGLDNTIYALKTDKIDDEQWKVAQEAVLTAFADAGMTDMKIVEVTNTDQIPGNLDKTDCKLVVGPVNKEINPVVKSAAKTKEHSNKTGMTEKGSQEAHVFTDRLKGGENNLQKGMQLGNVIGHEVGHGLGLSGHAENATTVDIMRAQHYSTRFNDFIQKYFNNNDALFLQSLNK